MDNFYNFQLFFPNSIRVSQFSLSAMFGIFPEKNLQSACSEKTQINNKKCIILKYDLKTFREAKI